MALTVPEIDDNDPVITRLTAQHQKQAAMLRGSMYEAIDTNPDQFAEQQRIAKQLGHTPAVVNELPELAKDAKLQQIEKNVANSPALKQKMADDIAFAKLAHDDTENLSLTEKTLSTIKNLGRSTKAALHGFNESVYGVAQSVTDIGAAALDPLVGTVLPANPFGLMSQASNNQRLKEKEIKQALEKARGDAGPTESAIYSGVQSATQSLLTLPLALMTRNPNVFSGTMAAQTGGQAYGEAIDAGKSPGQALPFAVSQGAIEYATEQLPAIKLLDGLKAKAPVLQIAKDFLVREIPGEQLATVLQDANDWAVLNPDKPFSEFIKERPGAAYQTLVSTVVGGSIQVGAGKALEYTANRFADRNKAEEVANQEYQAFQELDKLAASSKVRARDSETFQRFVETALEDGPVQDVYIDANTLAQSGVVEELAKVSPAVSEQFEQALQMGGSVRIPFAEYASQIAGTKYNQTLLQHLKTDPNGLTKAEAEEHANSYQQEFSKELDNTIQEQANDEAFKNSAAAVQSEIAKQIAGTNRFTADVAEANALVAASHYAVRAAQLGITPEDLYQSRPLRVTGERITSGLEQSNAQIETPQFKEWFAESKVTGTDGRPQLVYHGTRTDFNVFDNEAGVHFFTPDETEAKGYGSRQVPVYLAIQNPAPHSVFERTMTEVEQGEDAGGYDGVMSKTRDALIAQGYDGARYNGAYLAFYPEQIKSATGNNGNFDPNDPNILKQNNRGAYSPTENTIALLKNADLSTFLHELGHAFLTMDVNLASELAKNPQLSEGEQEIIDDVSKLFDWFGIQGDINAKLDQWFSMSIDEQRAHHEKLAEGFESYLFEGKAPSLELQPLFQRMRAWFINVYRNMMSYLAKSGETLTPEVRGVFDRMLASTEQIKLAQQARSMMPLFQTAEQAGMTIEEFAAYQKLDPQATQEAIAELQTRGLRDMQWLNNARSKVLKKLQKEVTSLRREVRMEASTEILSQPVYQAWTFLTAKQTQDDKLTPVDKKKSDPEVVDETRDNIFTAIAKLGGLNKEELIATWGVDAYGNPQSGVFGKPVWRVKGGLSIDAMAELLAERGYLKLDKHGKYDLRDFEDAFNEQLQGNKQVSLAYDYSQDQESLPGANINVNALGSGRLDRIALKDMYGQGGAATQLEGLTNLKMTSENGLHPDIVADMFGFSSGDELVKALLAADPPRQAIEDLTDTRMLERHGDISTPEALGRAADKAIHNEVRARMISTELNVLAKITGKRATLAKAARDFANEIVARLKIRDIRPNQYAVAEAKAAKNAASAMKKNDLETAAAEKRNQLVSNYATKAALKAKDEVDKGVAYLRKFGKEGVRKSLDVDYLDQIDALLDRFDLRTSISLKYLDKRAALVDWANKQRDQGFEPDVPQDLMNEAMRMPYKNMTLESFRGLVDTVKQIEHLGRLKNYLLTAKEQRTYEAIRDEIVFGIESNARGRKANTRTPTTDSGRMVQGLKNFWASHVKAATWARVMDGGKDGGPVWEYFIRSANEAADFETTERGKATEALSKTLAPVFALGKMGGKGQYFQSIDRSLNRESRIAIALNTGNASNLQRLLDGEGWTYQQLQPVLDSLTKAEWDAVQSIWDFFESYRPQIAAKERRVYGKEPNWIVPTPVLTKHGEYRGGYYPVKYDPAASQRAEEHIDAEEARQQIQGAYTSATTRRSFTKNRVEEVKGRPLLYTLGGVYSGVNEVIHDLAWHEWLIDANRLMRSSTIDGAIRNHYGSEVKRQFKSWIQDMATGERGADNVGEKVLGKLRQGVSIAGLGFNVLSAAIQVTGFSQSIVRVGAKWIGRGVTKYVANPVKTTREVTEASEFMASRFRTQFRELNELRNQVQDQSAARSAMQNGAYFMMTRVQQMVDVPTWLGAFEKAISQGNDEAKAVSLADQAVIDSQMSGMTKDLSEIERGGPAMKLFTVFYSYMNTTFNLGVMRYMTEANKAKLAADYLLLYVATPVLGLAVKNALTPGDAEDDWDLEALAKALLGESIGFMMGQMVIVREFSEAAKSALGLSHGAGYQGPAGVRVVNDATKFTQQARQGEFDDAFRKASINLISSLLGLPGAQINRTITGAQALSEGDTDNPAAVMFGYQEAR